MSTNISAAGLDMHFGNGNEQCPSSASFNSASEKR
jgi:hypothetical protein